MKPFVYFVLVIIALTLFGGCSNSDDTGKIPSNPSAEKDTVVIVKKDTIVIQNKDTTEVFAPSIDKIVFRCMDNPYQLNGDVVCDIIGDSLIICRIPYIVENKQLVPEFAFIGDKLLLDGARYEGGRYDFSKPVKLTLTAGDAIKNYTMYVHSFTGIPVVWIETEQRKDVTSKDEYLNASFKLEEGQITRGAGDVIYDSVKIKGRGNSSWEFDKKPYRLKFNKEVSFFGEPKDKSWVLIANYNDKTMLRNQMSFFLGKMSKLDWTPRAHFVELMLNGKYNGTYLLCEKVKISENRVNVGGDGLLMEVDGYATKESDSRYFSLKHFWHEVNIKAPHVEYGDEIYNYAVDVMTEAENTLFSDQFTDEKDGWRKYLDEDSFVDWYLINEIVKNGDAEGWSSIYFHCRRGEKIKMGPIWDFDQSFGNCDYEEGTRTPEGFWIWHMPWIAQLYKDPYFVKLLKERFCFFYEQKEAIFREINENAQYLRYAVVENENRWHTLYAYNWRNANIWGSYDNEVQFMKQWLSARLEWMKSVYDKM